jgi:hypothetical protein
MKRISIGNVMHNVKGFVIAGLFFAFWGAVASEQPSELQRRLESQKNVLPSFVTTIDGREDPGARSLANVAFLYYLEAVRGGEDSLVRIQSTFGLDKKVAEDFLLYMQSAVRDFSTYDAAVYKTFCGQIESLDSPKRAADALDSAEKAVTARRAELILKSEQILGDEAKAKFDLEIVRSMRNGSTTIIDNEKAFAASGQDPRTILAQFCAERFAVSK